jgi:type VI secretion system protein ImpM
MFPLTLVGASSEADGLTPPDVDPRDLWFGRVEDFLLDALEPETPFETIAARLDGLCGDVPPPGPSAHARMFAAMRSEQPDCPADAATFWWTVGGADCPPLAMMRRGMPDPASFADMLSRRESGRTGTGQQSPPQAAAQAG